MKTANKWNEIVGAIGVFNPKGILVIYKNAKVVSMPSSPKDVSNSFRIMSSNTRNLIISPDFWNLCEIAKKNCKII